MDGKEGGVRKRGFRVRGRVQGVGFRWWTRRTASELGLGGWVRNEPDGSVVVHVAGSAAAVEAMAHAVRSGPVGARVDAVEEITPVGELRPASFRIET